MNSYRLSRTAVAMVGALLVACGGKDTSRTEAPAPAAAPAPSTSPTTAPLTLADIDRWQRGMTAELEAVQQAAAKLKSAKTGEDTLSAMMAMQDMSTAAAGAKASAVVEALRPRAADLRKQDLELVATRLKGSGM